MDIYPKCYYGDDKLVVLENLILTKGFMLHKKEDMQDFDAAQFALSSLAKHHAISYAYIKDVGGPEVFFKRFDDFTFLGMDTESLRAMVMPFVEDPIGISISILSVSNYIYFKCVKNGNMLKSLSVCRRATRKVKIKLLKF